jgi:hypothetical protein
MKWVVPAAVVLVVVVVAVIVLVSRGSDDDPPPVAQGPGVVRVHTQYRGDGGLNHPTDVSYRGTTFQVAFAGASGSGDKLAAGLTVVGPRGTAKDFARYPQGATIELDGAALKVRTIYAGSSSDRDDLVDLQVLPAAR